MGAAWLALMNTSKRMPLLAPNPGTMAKLFAWQVASGDQVIASQSEVPAGNVVPLIVVDSPQWSEPSETELASTLLIPSDVSTCSVVMPLTLPTVAEIVVVPEATADATPVSDTIVATPVVEELQFAAVVRFWVELSE